MRFTRLAERVTLPALALSVLTAAHAWAEVPAKKAQQLVEQCREKTVQQPEGKALTGYPLEEETNAGSYRPGQPFELHINIRGHGNAVHNVTCHVDAQGRVSFEGIKERGSAIK
ncbi:hypothetical protein [Marinobacter mangrovi]|uniref:hypothetical protein n=1 Tax=Marinobacter mangrovi TaxID=2803918 RepID=UPI0019338595|nr:hypothetical protein [Marinobacter mangrovi]